MVDLRIYAPVLFVDIESTEKYFVTFHCNSFLRCENMASRVLTERSKSALIVLHPILTHAWLEVDTIPLGCTATSTVEL